MLPQQQLCRGTEEANGSQCYSLPQPEHRLEMLKSTDVALGNDHGSFIFYWGKTEGEYDEIKDKANRQRHISTWCKPDFCMEIE